MKNRQGVVWAPALIMVAVVVVAGVASYFLLQASKSENSNTNVAVVNQTNESANSNVNTNTTANTNSVSNTNTTADPTASWKTYTNTTNNYSIQYPPSWKVSEEWVAKHNTVQILPPDAVNKTSPERSPAIFIIPNQTYEEHDYVIKNDPKSDAHSNWRTQTINGISVKRQHESGLSTSDVAYFPTASGKYIQVSWDIGFVRDYPEYEQILANFAFTN